jgi:hypothetical protein
MERGWKCPEASWLVLRLCLFFFYKVFDATWRDEGGKRHLVGGSCEWDERYRYYTGLQMYISIASITQRRSATDLTGTIVSNVLMRNLEEERRGVVQALLRDYSAIKVERSRPQLHVGVVVCKVMSERENEDSRTGASTLIHKGYRKSAVE